MMEIKNRSGEIIFSHNCTDLKICIENAIKSGANLCGANLCGADLYGANLCGADLHDANLCGASLCGANLSGADLSGADLYGANLRGADLCGASLCGASLCGANLCGANLHGADLHDANLCGANLRGADLHDANLRGANLRGANLHGADLSGAKNAELALAMTLIVPQEGAFVGWKKLANGTIAKLVISHDAKRLNAYGSRKCRASKVFVHELFGESGFDCYAGNTFYEQGKEVFSDSFNEDRRIECTNGIHFFITREEAEAY